MKVILVDDEPLSLNLFKIECGNMPGFEVAGFFDNSRDALDYAQKNPVDFALLDIDIREPKRIAILEYEPRGTAQPPELHGGRLLQMAQRYVQGEQTLCAVVNRRLLLVFGPEQKALEVLKQFQQAAESFYEVTLSGGLSSLSRGAEDIRRCYNEAKIAARSAAKNHTILEYSGISLDFVLQNLEPKVKADVCRAIFEAVPEDEREELLECGRLAGVKTQREVLPFGGTDASAMQTSRGGIPVCTVSIPCRYVHSACEVIDMRDMDAALKLLTTYLTR